jgi:hypothetical protein
MMRALGWQWIPCGVLIAVLSGCATFGAKDLSWGSRIGLRPDAPQVQELMDAPPCQRFVKFTQYAKDLEEAYRTEAAVFGAPQPAGPTAASTAAPAAAGPAPPAPVQPALAGAAVPAKVPPPSDAVCATHLSELIHTVSEARNKLDSARTDSAEGALIRATAGPAALKDIVAAQTPKDITSVKLPGQITKIDNVAGTFRVPTGGKLVPLTVTNAPLDQAVPADIKIALGSKVFEMAATFPAKKGTHEYDVMLQIPATPPDGDSVKSYIRQSSWRRANNAFRPPGIDDRLPTR